MTPEERAERVHVLVATVPTVHYDTHGWFVCAWCAATSGIVREDVPEAEWRPGHPVGFLRHEHPFPHKDNCELGTLEARVVDLVRVAVAEEQVVATLEGAAEGWRAACVAFSGGIPYEAACRIAVDNADELVRQAAVIRAQE